MGVEVAVDSERLVTVENDVRHLTNDVGEIKTELYEFRAIHSDVANSLARLTVLAEQAPSMNSKMDIVFARLRSIEKWMYTTAGIATAAMTILTMFGDEIKKALGF